MTIDGSKKGVLGCLVVIHEKADTGMGANGEAGSKIADELIGSAR